jgi:RNA-directed DNA polymerase
MSGTRRQTRDRSTRLRRRCATTRRPGCSGSRSASPMWMPFSLTHRFGYTFRPRKAVDKYGRVYVNFSPGVSREALRTMRQTVRGWHLQLMNDNELSDLSNMFGPVIRGWANYYGRFHPTALKPLWRHVNDYLVRWMRRKHKHLARGVTRAARALARLADSAPRSFVHWEWGFFPAAR